MKSNMLSALWFLALATGPIPLVAIGQNSPSLIQAVANAPLRSKTTTVGNITFTLPEGLKIERVADEALIQWPIAATYHVNGDLLILECHWTREKVQQQLESKPHKIVRLTDTNGDGKYDKRTVIADQLGFPEGIMVFGNDLLVTAPPQILRLADKDGDGFFEGREVWFDAATLTNCANDLHGPMMGPDGWVYWTKGAFAEQNHELIRRADKSEGDILPSKASHIYRRHPTGGPIERLMTGGMDNPSDLTFSPEGEIFFCSTFLHHPGNGLRDGIAHSPRGGMFGKQQQVLDGHKTTGPLLQPIANLGPAAPASVHCLSSNAIPAATVGSEETSSPGNDLNRFLVSSQFNLQKVGLHRLIPVGASFETETHDLLSADRIDFHPVDVLEEANGSLLVFDTGGWYDLCCPSSGSDQSIARGGVYRLSVNSRSENPTPIVPFKRDEAKRVAGDQTQRSETRKRALWTVATELTASPGQTDLAELVISLLSDSDPTIQQVAARIVGLNRWTRASGELAKLIQSPSAATVRSGIEALGVVGDSTSLTSILSALSRFPKDRYIVHSTIYAFMEIGATDELIRIAKDSSDDYQRHVAIHALDQMGKMPDELLPMLVQYLNSPYRNLQELSLKCLVRHPSGIALCIPFLRDAWNREQLSTLESLSPLVLSGTSNDAVRTQIAEWIQAGPSLNANRQDWLLTCLQKLGGEPLPSEWTKSLANWIDTSTSDESLIKIASSIRNSKFANSDRDVVAKALVNRAGLVLNKPKVAIALLAACPNIAWKQSKECSELIVQQLMAADQSDAVQAESALARSAITKESALLLLNSLEQVPPLYLQSAIEAMLRCNEESIDAALVGKLPSVPATKTLSIDRVAPLLSKRSDAFRKQWGLMMQAATRPPDDIAESLDAWLERLPKGDATKGYHVFRGSKAACSSCHQVGYVGGRLGPELSKIGKTRTRRDLVEAIVFPSFRMAQGYYPVRIRTVNDEVFNGLLSKQTDSYVELLCGADKVCRVAKEDVADQSESKVSVMPTGLDQQMTITEFADLLAFLESKK
jgi:putative membrane-bound dehydrogenase-like protein